MDKLPLVQRILELEEKVKELEKIIPILQKEIGKAREFIGMNDGKETRHKNNKIKEKN